MAEHTLKRFDEELERLTRERDARSKNEPPKR